MNKRLPNFYLMLVLAFLQCLTPLLHAHAGGQHDSSHAHVHFGAAVSSHSTHFPEFAADSSDFPVVGVASEFKRDPASDDFVSMSPRPSQWLLPPPRVSSSSSSSSILSARSFFWGSPPSQAPPKAS